MYNIIKIVSGVFVFLCVQQSAFAQSADQGSEMSSYMKVLLVVLLLLIASIFFVLFFFDDKWSEEPEKTVEKDNVIIRSSPGLEFGFNTKITYLLKMAFYSAIMVSVLYLITIIILLKTI